MSANFRGLDHFSYKCSPKFLEVTGDPFLKKEIFHQARARKKTQKKSLLLKQSPNLSRQKGQLSKNSNAVIIKKQDQDFKKKLFSFISHALFFSLIAGIVHSFASLTGQILMESARRDRIRAIEREQVVRQEIHLLQEKMDFITSLNSIDTWARSRGFESPDGSAEKYLHQQAERKRRAKQEKGKLN